MNKEFLKLGDEDIEFDLSLLDINKDFFWRIKLDEGDGNSIYYGDYCSNKTIFELYKKLEEYFEGTKYNEVTNVSGQKYYVLED